MDNATKPKSAFAKRYKKLEKLGEGSYGVVYKAKDVIEDLVFPYLINSLSQSKKFGLKTKTMESHILPSEKSRC